MSCSAAQPLSPGLNVEFGVPSSGWVCHPATGGAEHLSLRSSSLSLGTQYSAPFVYPPSLKASISYWAKCLRSRYAKIKIDGSEHMADSSNPFV